MNKKYLIIAMALLVVLVGIALGYSWYNSTNKKPYITRNSATDGTWSTDTANGFRRVESWRSGLD